MRFISMRLARLTGGALIAFFCTACGSAPANSGSGGSGGGDTASAVNINEPARPLTQVEGFFDAKEPWAVGSPNFLAFGVGDFIDLLLVSTGQAGGAVCLAPSPAATIGYSDGALRLVSQAITDPTGVNCSANISVGAAECAPDASPGGPPNPCLPQQLQGEVILNEQTFSPDSPRIVRLASCIGASSLSSLGDWGIYNVHPFALSYIADPTGFGAVMAITGSGDSQGASSIVTAFARNGSPLGCVDDKPSGTITLQNDAIGIDLTFDGQGNSLGAGTPGVCTLQFTGTLTFCEILDPSALGGPGQAVRLERFDGTGAYQAPGRSGPIGTIYFSSAESAGSNGTAAKSQKR